MILYKIIKYLSISYHITSIYTIIPTFPTKRFCRVSGRDMSGNFSPTNREFFKNSCK